MPEINETQHQGELGQLGLGVQTDTDDLSDLPAEMVNQLDQFQEGSRQIFIAAFKSGKRDGMGEQEAIQMAWNTVRADYQQGEDGTWHLKARQTENIHNHSVQSGGN